MPKYIKRKVIDREKITDGSLACVECGNSYYITPNTEGYVGLTIVRVRNIDDSDNQQDNDSINKLYIHAVCNHCSMMNVFVYKLKIKKGCSWYKLSEVWLEVADEQ